MFQEDREEGRVKNTRGDSRKDTLERRLSRGDQSPVESGGHFRWRTSAVVSELVADMRVWCRWL